MARTQSRLNKRVDVLNRFRVNRFRAKNRILKETITLEHGSMQETFFQQSQNTSTNLSTTSQSDFENDVNIISLLRAWVNCHGITTRAVNDLLKILKTAGYYSHTKIYSCDCIFTSLLQLNIYILLLGMNELPNDYRSLLRTPRFIEISSVGGGQMWYNGIATNLKNIFSKLSEDITIALNFNMDGLPLFKSSQRCFWPILGSIHGDLNIMKFNVVHK